MKMTFTEALKRLRNDMKLWTTNNLNTKLNKVDERLEAEDKDVIATINRLLSRVSALEENNLPKEEEEETPTEE